MRSESNIFIRRDVSGEALRHVTTLPGPAWATSQNRARVEAMRARTLLALVCLTVGAAIAACGPAPLEDPDASGGKGGSGGSGVGGTSSCAQGQTSCNGICTDTKTDFRNCGACGTMCGSSQACVASACICTSGLQACGQA